jgi:predicted amidophosphoribosyltransferase
MQVRICTNCYGDIHDERHVICPHCGTRIKQNQFSSEDADDGYFSKKPQEKKTLTKQGTPIIMTPSNPTKNKEEL